MIPSLVAATGWIVFGAVVVSAGMLAAWAAKRIPFEPPSEGD